MRRRCPFLSELDGLADAVSAVEFVGGGPDDFRDDGEEGGEEVGDGEVQDEVVHPTHLAAQSQFRFHRLIKGLQGYSSAQLRLGFVCQLLRHCSVCPIRLGQVEILLDGRSSLVAAGKPKFKSTKDSLRANG